jgi:Zn-dependent M16 (insulinase) family peptidase
VSFSRQRRGAKSVTEFFRKGFVFMVIQFEWLMRTARADPVDTELDRHLVLSDLSRCLVRVDPTVGLDDSIVFSNIRDEREANPILFQELIGEHFLIDEHRLFLILRAVPGMIEASNTWARAELAGPSKRWRMNQLRCFFFQS